MAALTSPFKSSVAMPWQAGGLARMLRNCLILPFKNSGLGSAVHAWSLALSTVRKHLPAASRTPTSIAKAQVQSACIPLSTILEARPGKQFEILREAWLDGLRGHRTVEHPSPLARRKGNCLRVILIALPHHAKPLHVRDSWMLLSAVLTLQPTKPSSSEFRTGRH